MTDIDPQGVQEAPCTIYTKSGLGRVFVVEDVGGWAYQDWGVFASGYWKYEGPEEDVLIPYSEITHISFDFAALERYHAAQLIEAATAEPSDDEPEADAA